MAGKEIVLGCVDCHSSMSLVDAIIRQLFPDFTVKWILYQSHEYTPGQRRYLSAFPQDRLIRKDGKDWIRLQPLTEGITDEEAAAFAHTHNAQYIFGGMDVGSQRSPNLNRLLKLLNPLLLFEDNDPNGARVRLEKSLSAAVSKEYAIPTHELKNVEDAIRWIKSLGNSEVIVKPNVGVLGRDTVYLKTNNEEVLRTELTRLLATDELFLIQPKIIGRKFFADTFTYNGVTKILSAAEYFQIEYQEKPNYFLDGFLELSSDEVARMQTAVNFLMPAHNIIIGMAHPEFIFDLETGRIYILEMNGRVGGGGLPAVDAEVYGISQLHLLILYLFDRERFLKEFANFPRERQKSGFMFFLSSPGAGIWNPSAIQALRAHPSYFLPGSQYEIYANGRVEATEGMDSSQGYFYFVGTHGEVKSGVEAAVSSFINQQFIDHTHIYNSGGSIVMQSCGTAFDKTANNHSTLVERMRAAMQSIDWSKF